MKNTLNKSASKLLRQRAEELLKLKPSGSGSPISETDMLKLIHEFNVHQIELEMQNEELVLAKSAEQDAIELYDFAPTGYFTLSNEGEILNLNLYASQMLGKEPQRLKNSRLGFFISDDTKPIFNLFLGKIFNSKAKETCEVTLSTKLNIPMAVHLTGILTGNRELCYVTAVDITERKRAEEKLSRSEKELKNVQQITHIGSWYLDMATNQVVWTEELYKMYGFDATLPPPPYTEHQKLCTPESWEMLSSSLANTSETGIPYELELKTVREDGSNGWMWVRGETVPDNEGKIVGLWGAAQDITERKQLEDVLTFLSTSGYLASDENFFESLSKYLAKILDSEYVCIDKLEGDRLTAQTVGIYNEGKLDPNVSYTLKQTPCGEVVGKTICCFPENVCQLFPHDKALQDLKAHSYIGTTLWSFKGNPIGLIAVIGQKPLKNIAFAENILKIVAIRAAGELERKQAEDELMLAKEKAEESDRLKSAFLANMSHEIRTPMNGILGFASLLKEPNLTGEDQQRFIRIIEKSGDRMLNIINDIIDISKIEAGSMEVNLKETNINDQIEYIYAFFKPEVEAKGMHLSFKNSLPAKEAFIKTDREKVYAILTNLVKNAIKYSHGGSIDFGYDLVKTQHAASLQFFVKDTGIGIAKNRQEAIFERFIQADIEDPKALQGAGLGLAIAKAYAEMLGGVIWVKSDEEIGSTFYFTIPYKTKQQGQSDIENVVYAEDIDVQIEKLKILIAEDDQDSDFLITSVLKKNNHEILHTETGVEAIEMCRKNPDLDLILMDIRMPGMSGYEATRQIRGFNKKVIIIAQTAYGLSGDRQKSIDAGCNDYLSKPIVKDELLRLIQKHFHR